MSNSDAPTTIGSDLQALIEAFDGTDVMADSDWVEFFVDELYVIANVVDVAGRLRIRVYLHIDDERLVKDWVAQRSAPRSGLLQASCIEEGEWRPRLVFERPVGDHDWSTDPLLEDVALYLAAWLDDIPVEYASGNRAPYVIQDDPRDVSPGSAWLLMGSESSFPTREDLHSDRAAANVGIFTWDWTTASQTQIGDLVLIYFVSPRKAVQFVARAASTAFFSRDIAVNADGLVSKAQWWGYFTTPIEIEPIPLDALRWAAGGYLPLRGRSGLYLRPDAIAALQIRAAHPADQAELERVFSVPIGLAELPDPADITYEVWRDLAAGALPFEAHVSTHLVEPLLRDLLVGTGLTWQREYRVEKRRADFVIVDEHDAPVHVIEVKKVIKADPQSGWNGSPDFAQMRWYADQLGTSGTLIDSHRVLLVERGGDQPLHEIIRRSSTETDLKAIRQHMLGL